MGALLAFCGLDESLGMLSSLHDTRDLLEARLGMLRLRAANDHGGAAAIAAAAAAAAQLPRVGVEDATVAAAAPAAAAAAVEEEEECSSIEGDGDEDDDAASSVGGGACDEATWEILSRLLGFEHTFEPSHCARILYLSLGPALRRDDATLSRVRPTLTLTLTLTLLEP